MATYAIKDWDKTFEDRRSREIGELRFVKFPVRQDGESFCALMRSNGGVIAYGVFCALVQIAARCPDRGVLADAKGPYTPERAAKRLGIPARLMRAAWCVLASAEIGWLVATDSRSTADENGAQSAHGADDAPLLCNHTVPDQDKTVPDQTTPSAATGDRSAAEIGWTRSGGFVGITDDDRAAWAKAYPACNLDRQFAAMAEWLKANDTKAHKSNWRKFITNWLSRSQDRGGDVRSVPVNGTAHRRQKSDAEYAAEAERIRSRAV